MSYTLVVENYIYIYIYNKTSTFTGTQDSKVFDIFHTVNCQSTFVIYIIECKICKLQYVGKSETAFNL